MPGVRSERKARRPCWAFTLLAVALVGCSQPPPPAPPAPKPELHAGPLTDYVPAAGLRWMIVGSPSRIANSTAMQSALRQLFPNERLDAFRSGTGVDLRQTEQAAVASFDLGLLYLATPKRGSFPQIARLFEERLSDSGRSRQPHPSILRISGVAGGTPEVLSQIDQRVLAVAVGDPTLARVAEAYAMKKLRRSPTALRGAALSSLPGAPAEALAVFYAPGPFASEWAHAAGGLLAHALAVSAYVVPNGADHVRVTVQFAGNFPQTGPDRLTEAFRQLAESSLGKLLALDQTDSPPVVREREQSLSLELNLASAPIAEGLRAAVIADIWEILRIPKPTPQPEAPAP